MRNGTERARNGLYLRTRRIEFISLIQCMNMCFVIVNIVLGYLFFYLRLFFSIWKFANGLDTC